MVSLILKNKVDMRNIKTKLALFLYKGLGKVFYPFALLYITIRAMRGKEELKRKCERFGKATKRRPKGPLIWLHAASVGESMALIPIVEHILLMKINVLLTTGTVASARLVDERFSNRVIHQYVPLDIVSCMSRFLGYWRPDISIVCESEIWPVRIYELAKYRVPQIMLNAHLSDKSYKTWKKHLGLAHDIFSKFDAVVCQGDNDAGYFRDLGVLRVFVSGNLKADVILPGKPADIKRYQKAIGDRPVWAAISTHEGEEIMAADVHKKLMKKHPGLLTIIVPRHVERAPKIARYFDDVGLTFSSKAYGQIPDDNTDIILGDTVGDMGLYLRLTQIAFVGKSLAGEGGHNPLEPALTGAAILSGPNIQNFKATYQALMKNDAVQVVDDATMLAGFVHHLLERPDARARMIESGRQTAAQLSGASEICFEILERFLQPLTLAAQLNPDDNYLNKSHFNNRK